MVWQAMMSQSVLNLYQRVLIKWAKIYHLHHCFITASNSYQWVNNSCSLRSLVNCFTTAPVELVFNQKIRKKAVQLSLPFGLSLQSLSLHQNRLIFFIVVQNPHVPCALRCPCVYWYHFLLNVHHWNCFHTQYIKQNLHVSGISEWIWIYYTTLQFFTLQIVEFYTIILFLWRSWLWIVRHLFCNVLIFCNNWKVWLEWKRNSMSIWKF